MKSFIGGLMASVAYGTWLSDTFDAMYKDMTEAGETVLADLG